MPVYKWVHEDKQDEVLYVGSTNDMRRRKYEHKQQCRLNNSPFHRWINEKQCWEQLRMEVIEKCADEIRVDRELHWWLELKPKFGNIPRGQSEAAMLKQRELSRIRSRKWSRNNPDYQKNYKKENCVKVKKQARKPWHCEVCNCTVQHKYQAGHKKTQKHLRNLSKKPS